MKIAIIGGGIAGLTQAIFLKKNGHEVMVFERMKVASTRGHAFLMSGEGLAVLRVLEKDTEYPLRTNKINSFTHCTPDETESVTVSLDDWYCLKRKDLRDFLCSFLHSAELKYDHEFSHFEYGPDGKAVAVNFLNGQQCFADMFIGADGGNSSIRQELFGETDYTPVEVKEIVGFVDDPSNTKLDEFIKVQSKDKGLSLGLIPLNDKQSVWYMQYDVKFENGINLESPEEKKDFCRNLMADFPDFVGDIIEKNDFADSYIWKTRDFDSLSSYHKDNIVLIGDAAHLTLPFTSAGNTLAILDALTLADKLNTHSKIDSAFRSYYFARREEIKSYIERGRLIKRDFLFPMNSDNNDRIIPLISREERRLNSLEPISILYFTDPICSSCLLFHSVLLKFELEYGEYFDISKHMGGLLKDWSSRKGREIESPDEAAVLWSNLGDTYGFPITGSVWIDDPLDSSNPPSIAIKAAQFQDPDKALLFSHRLKHLLFIHNINISRWEVIRNTAIDVGLDDQQLHADMKNRGIKAFNEDLELANQLDIHNFPTLVFRQNGKKTLTIKGSRSYQDLVNILKFYIPSIERRFISITPEELFDRNPIATVGEFGFVMNMSRERSREELEKLRDKGKIKHIKTKSWDYWELISKQ